MSASFPIAIAGEPLLALAESAGSCHPTGCAALLNLLTTSENLSEVLRRELGRQQLSVVGFGILTRLAARSDAPQSTGDLATALDRPAQVVSHALARLELAHYISRSRDPENRRQNRIQLTRQGRTAIRRALQEFETVIHRLMSVLTTEEITVLQRVCSRLCPASILFSK